MSDLTILREEINLIDDKLLNLLKEREIVSINIAKYKIKNNLDIFQPEREKEVLKSKQKLAKELNLNPESIKNIFQKIMDESKNKQKEIIKNVN